MRGEYMSLKYQTYERLSLNGLPTALEVYDYWISISGGVCWQDMDSKAGLLALKQPYSSGSLEEDLD